MKDRFPYLRFILAFICALLLVHAQSLSAADESDRRLQAGVRLFRSLLAADLDLTKKTVAGDKLLIVFYYTDSPPRARESATTFAGDGSEQSQRIRGLPVEVETHSDPSFAKLAGRTPAGIFLAQPPSPDALQAIIRYGIEHRVIIYSPFEGHVEKGILAGLSVEAQVRPYINSETLAASLISLKPFFLKVAKVYP